MFVCLTNDTTYLTGNEGQKFQAVLSENAPLQGESGSSIVQLMRSWPFFITAENAHAHGTCPCVCLSVCLSGTMSPATTRN